MKSLADKISQISTDFAAQRSQRQLLTRLNRDDFQLLKDAQYPLVVLPENEGGFWKSFEQSTRSICNLLRTLAQGDSSLALVSAMHPAVVSYWLALQQEGTDNAQFNQQTHQVFESMKQGFLWGTITSEPGSGGDVSQTRTKAEPTGDDHQYLLTGQKHFGSGSGIADFMVTSARVSEEDEPDWFFFDMRGVDWETSKGIRLLAPWDGHGMIATQSHSFEFDQFPATRIAMPGNMGLISSRVGGFIGCLFSSVIVGITDVAMSTAQEKISQQQTSAYEQVEWVNANKEHWLIQQAWEGIVTAVESKADPRLDVLQGKTAIAELSESLMTKLCRLMGGGSFSRKSPFGFWFEDVRALGFLRPPWGLAYQTMIDGLLE